MSLSFEEIDRENRDTHPYVVDMPERPYGLARGFDRIADWLEGTYGTAPVDRFRMLGLRVYFTTPEDAERFEAALPELIGAEDSEG